MLLENILIIWDCDGVLVDSELLGAKAFAEIIRQYGVQIDDITVHNDLKGGNMHASLAYLRNLVGHFDPEDIEMRYRKRSFELFESELKAVEGVEQNVYQLSNNRCIASNGPKAKITKNLALTGLSQYFDETQIFSGHDINSFKPDPDLFLHAASSMGFLPKDCIVIEDSLHGMLAAYHAGMKCYWYGGVSRINGNYTSFYHMTELIPLIKKEFRFTETSINL